jgi:hypothetical protein
MRDSIKTQNVCKHCHGSIFYDESNPNMGYWRHVESASVYCPETEAEPVSEPASTGKQPSPVVEYKNRFGVMSPDCTFGCNESQYDQRCNIHRPTVTQPVSGDAPKIKYKLALKWIKMLWKYGEFTGACGSALREDGELKELLREADRIR